MNILITSDDGYRSAGVRILVHLLKENHSLKIAATNSQQSSVGAKLTVRTGGKWGTDNVDGVEALWVDGTPADAIECAKTYFTNEKFDLCVSGINYGPNVASELVSGTVSAAVRSVVTGLVYHSIAFSMEISERHWLDDSSDHDIKELITYPGKQAKDLINSAIKNNHWEAQILNINFPLQQTNRVRFTRPYPFNHKVYNGGTDLYAKPGQYIYAPGKRLDLGDDLNYDAVALRAGFITINLLKPNLENELKTSSVIGKEIDLN